jgi:hypothetical protein
METLRAAAPKGSVMRNDYLRNPRIRRVAQGKCRHRFDVGDWNAGDGLGGSQPCGTTRWRDRTLKCHFVEMRAPAASEKNPGPAARAKACIGQLVMTRPHRCMRHGKSRPVGSPGGSGRF